MKIEMVDVTKIKPAKYNPRAISDNAFEGLKESLKKFGFVDPLVVNTRTGNLIGGHQRLKAAESLGIKKVPVVNVDLSLTEEKALNITLNNTAISGHYTDALQELLSEIKLDLPEFGELRLDALEINTDGVDLSSLGFADVSQIDLRGDDDFEFKPKDKSEKEVTFTASEKLCLQITCPNADDQETMFNELKRRGYRVKVV